MKQFRSIRGKFNTEEITAAKGEITEWNWKGRGRNGAIQKHTNLTMKGMKEARERSANNQMLIDRTFETSAILTLANQAADKNCSWWKNAYNLKIIEFDRAVKIYAYLAKHGMKTVNKKMQEVYNGCRLTCTIN